jgi:hypothetical protein
MGLRSMVYYGSPRDMIPHFDRLVPESKCPVYTNPAEHMAELVHVSMGALDPKTARFAEACQALPAYQTVMQWAKVWHWIHAARSSLAADAAFP